jgi:outer membrane protein TolC
MARTRAPHRPFIARPTRAAPARSPARALACALALASPPALAACTASSIGSDLSRVRELSAAPVLPALESERGVRDADQQAQALLQKPLDADGAVRVALLSNRELRAQLHALGIARGQLMQAGMVDNPSVGAEAIVEEPVELELRVEYDISSLLLAPLRADAAEAELEAERHHAAAAVVRLGYEVRAALTALQAAERRVEIGRQALEAYGAGRDAMAALRKAGNVRELDAISHAAAYERARVRFAELELERTARRERLLRALGIEPPHAALRVQPGPPDVPETVRLPPGAGERAVAASLELGETQHRAQAAELRADARRTEGWLPEIEVGVLSLYEQRTATPDFGDDAAWRWGGGVTLSLPLFDRGHGAVRALEAEQARLVDRHAAAAADLRSRAREVEQGLRSAHARAQQFKTAILPAHARLVEQTLLQYNAMQASVFDLLQARREQLEAELAYVETLREYWTVATAMDALLAGARAREGAFTSAAEPDAGWQDTGVRAGGH